MKDEIVNRVAQSSLIVFDLEDYFPKCPIVFFDIKQWLWQEMILKEKDFREYVNQYNWSKHEGQYIAIDCTTEAIIPQWAYMLVASNLIPYANWIIQGNVEQLLAIIYSKTLSEVDYSYCIGKSVIIKGCSKKPVPQLAYILAMQYIQPLAKSVMYGEACSAVPIFKKSN